MALAQLMVVLDATLVNIALPAAQADLGFSDGDRQWIITAYSLAFGSLLLLGGRLSDLWGQAHLHHRPHRVRRRVRARRRGADLRRARHRPGAAGVFGALLAPTALAVLTTTFTIPRERARAFGVFGAIAGAGGAIGLLLGGFLTEQFNWRWNLYINVFIALVAVIGALLFVRHVARTGPRPKLDLPGTVLVSAALFLLVYGFSNAETEGWDSPVTWGMLAASAVLLVVFVLWQRRAAHPLLPLAIVLDRNRGAAYPRCSSPARDVRHLPLRHLLPAASLGYSPIQTGLAFLPMILHARARRPASTNIFVPRSVRSYGPDRHAHRLGRHGLPHPPRRAELGFVRHPGAA